jgi:hypothetical protein
MKRIATLSLAVILGLTLAYAVSAQAFGGGMGWGGGRGGGWGGHMMAPGHHMNYNSGGAYSGTGYCPGWGGGNGQGYGQGYGPGYRAPDNRSYTAPGWQRPGRAAPHGSRLPAGPVR